MAEMLDDSKLWAVIFTVEFCLTDEQHLSAILELDQKLTIMTASREP